MSEETLLAGVAARPPSATYSAAHYECATAKHDLVLEHIQSGVTMLGSALIRAIVYCRRCPYHYFPQTEKNE